MPKDTGRSQVQWFIGGPGPSSAAAPAERPEGRADTRSERKAARRRALTESAVTEVTSDV